MFELMEKWFAYEEKYLGGEYAAGLGSAAAELEDWLRTHEPEEYERYRQQKEAEEQ